MSDINDDDIKAMENRLRTSGWTAISSRQPQGLTKPERKVKSQLNGIGATPSKAALTGRKDQGFGHLGTKERSIGKWLAEHPYEIEAPIYTFVSRKFSVSYDVAVRAVAEAERIVGSRGQ